MLTHFSPILHFYTPWKRQKTIDFLIFPVSIKKENVCRLFQILAQFPFTKSETELDYYHQKVNARVVSQIAKLFK